MQQFNPYLNQQPMMNSPYQNGYNPMLSPQQRLMQMEQQYPQYSQQNQFVQQPAQQQTQGLNCVVVDDFNAISANDVPMDGKGAVFMLRGGSQIQWRNWTANGTIQTIPYSPAQPENSTDGTNIPQTDFNALNEDVRALREDIKGVREIIEKSMTVPTPKATSSRAKKGADEE